MKYIIFMMLFLGIFGTAFAVEPEEVLSDPVLEMRARALSEELRCVVCQGESIDASSASVAKDLRVLLREKLVEGLSDQEIKDYLTSRYGDFILLKPRFGGAGAVLWLMGPILFLLGAIFVAIFIRGSGKVEIDDE